MIYFQLVLVVGWCGQVTLQRTITPCFSIAIKLYRGSKFKSMDASTIWGEDTLTGMINFIVLPLIILVSLPTSSVYLTQTG